jgi:TPP-dependent pyruvate/acetoin dehydrogenase alpha subunit
VRDPVGLYEAWLQGGGIAPARLTEIEDTVSAEVDRAADEALASRQSHIPKGETAVEGVYVGE